jgi:hypothetical protein
MLFVILVETLITFPIRECEMTEPMHQVLHEFSFIDPLVNPFLYPLKLITFLLFVYTYDSMYHVVLPLSFEHGPIRPCLNSMSMFHSLNKPSLVLCALTPFISLCPLLNALSMLHIIQPFSLICTASEHTPILSIPIGLVS